jgi:hypothetical protein
LCDSTSLAVAQLPNSLAGLLWGFGRFISQTAQEATSKFFSPFLNATVLRLMNWHYSTSTKSVTALNSLVHDIILVDDFDHGHLHGFSATHELNRLDKYNATNDAFSAEDGWLEGSVKIQLPHSKVKYKSESEASEFSIHGIYYRPLLEVVKAAYQDLSAFQYHFTPFKLFSENKTAQDLGIPSDDCPLHGNLQLRSNA